MSETLDAMFLSATRTEQTTPTTRNRQRPGSACEECRRKKLRCDRNKPCGGCIDSGVTCYVSAARAERGPKRGHLKLLRSRIEALERRIQDQDDTLPNAGEQPLDLDDDVYLGTRKSPSPSVEVPSDDLQPLNSPSQMQIMELCGPESLGSSSRQSTINMPALQPLFVIEPSSLGATGPPIPMLMRADLDQLFFDRVHNSTPILQHSRYSSWARKPWSSASRVCLQYAVWTSAASLSSQFQSFNDGLYRDTRQMLEALELEDIPRDDGFYLEMAQAWILLANYEFMQTTFRRAWISAGTVFRLVQLMKLHEVDSLAYLNTDIFGTSEEWVETEEKRRTFWMAYCLDRFCCGLKGLSLTLDEKVISTRLPSPESEFQSGIPVQTPFLSEIMAANDITILSPFSECIIFSTLWGRSLYYQQKSTVERIYGNCMTEFWDLFLQLDSTVTQRLQLLLQHPNRLDSMSLFTIMIAQATVLALCKVTDSMLGHADVSTEHQRYVKAAQETVKSSKCLRRLSYFKVHPFTPIPLLLCGEYFTTHRSRDAAFATASIEIIEALRELKNVNVASHSYLEQLESNTSNEFCELSYQGSRLHP